MIAIVLVVLYLIVLPVAGLWFVQSRLPKPPTEFELQLARMRRDIALVQVQLGEQLLPVCIARSALDQPSRRVTEAGEG